MSDIALIATATIAAVALAVLVLNELQRHCETRDERVKQQIHRTIKHIDETHSSVRDMEQDIRRGSSRSQLQRDAILTDKRIKKARGSALDAERDIRRNSLSRDRSFLASETAPDPGDPSERPSGRRRIEPRPRHSQGHEVFPCVARGPKAASLPHRRRGGRRPGAAAPDHQFGTSC